MTRQRLKETAAKYNLKIANLASYVGGGVDGRRTAWSFHGWTVPRPEQFTTRGFASDSMNELETEMRQMERAIDLAEFFGARCVRVVPGDDQPSSLDRVVPWLKKSADYAARKNIFLGMENHSGNIAGTPELCVELAEKVGSKHFGVLYEPGNLLADTGTDYKQALLTMRDHIVHCHFKDCKPSANGYEMVMMGDGVIDFPWIMERLDASGYDGDIALEYEIHGAPPETGLEVFLSRYLQLF